MAEAHTCYRAVDGREFDNEADCKRYEELRAARETLEQARRAYSRIVAESQRTADGHLFDFSVCADYYYVQEWDWPSIQTVHFYFFNTDVSEDEEVSLTTRKDGGDRGPRYRIKSLYRNKKAARRALLDAMDKRIADLQADRDKLAAEVGR